MAGVYPGSKYDPEKCPFWPREFRRQGYQTAQIGKWHTGTDSGYGRDWDYQIVWNRPAPRRENLDGSRTGRRSRTNNADDFAGNATADGRVSDDQTADDYVPAF